MPFWIKGWSFQIISRNLLIWFCPDRNTRFPSIPPHRNFGWNQSFFDLRIGFQIRMFNIIKLTQTRKWFYLSVEGAVYGVVVIFVLMYDSIIKVVCSHSGCVFLFNCMLVIRDRRTAICDRNIVWTHHTHTRFDLAASFYFFILSWAGHWLMIYFFQPPWFMFRKCSLLEKPR